MVAAPKGGPAGFLRLLGEILEHLEGVAGVPDTDPPCGTRRAGGRQLMAPLGPDAELTPSRVGLLLHEGAWRPIVSAMVDARDGASGPQLISLPEGQPLPRSVHLSAPVAPLSLLVARQRFERGGG